MPFKGQREDDRRRGEDKASKNKEEESERQGKDSRSSNSLLPESEISVFKSLLCAPDEILTATELVVNTSIKNN